MPGFTTHFLFGQQTYQTLPASDMKRTIQKYHRVYALGLQGPDIFFYEISSFLSRKKNPGSIAHTANTGAFLEQLLKCPMYFPSIKEQQIAQTYALGFVGHYLLDTACHPYIYARSGYPKNPKGYMGHHLLLETDIDNSLLWFFQHKHPSEFHQSDAIALTKEQMQVISTLLYIAFKKTYPALGITKPQIVHAILSMQKGTRMLYDASGCKKAFVRRLEAVFPGYPILSPLIASDTLLFHHDPCNAAHKSWQNPWDTSHYSSESFFDLFEKALTQYQAFLHQTAVCFARDCSLRQKDEQIQNALSRLGSRSYHSGLELSSASDLL